MTLSGCGRQRRLPRHRKSQEIECDFIAGCDGFDAQKRAAWPDPELAITEAAGARLCETRRRCGRAVAVRHRFGFALCSMRLLPAAVTTASAASPSDINSCRTSGSGNGSSSDSMRGPDILDTGPSLEPSIAPLPASSSPMRSGEWSWRTDAAHIVPADRESTRASTWRDGVATCTRTLGRHPVDQSDAGSRVTIRIARSRQTETEHRPGR